MGIAGIRSAVQTRGELLTYLALMLRLILLPSESDSWSIDPMLDTRIVDIDEAQ